MPHRTGGGLDRLVSHVDQIIANADDVDRDGVPGLEHIALLAAGTAQHLLRGGGIRRFDDGRELGTVADLTSTT